MKYGWSNRRALAAAVAALVLGSVAYADDTANMQVTATVAPACELVSVPTIAFGLVDTLVNNDAQGVISWRCTTGLSTAIELNGGGSGVIAARRMLDGLKQLPYQLYTDAGRTAIFGDGVSGNTIPVTGTGYATSADVTVYGRVSQAAAGAAAGGNYADTVLVTILF